MTAQLDRTVDALGLNAGDIQGLFDVADALAKRFRLRATLSDPALSGEARRIMVQKLFEHRVPRAAVMVVAEVSAIASDPGWLEREVERQGARAVLKQASSRQDGSLDQIQDELFRVARIISADADLLRALSDPLTDVATRTQLMTAVLADKAHTETLTLAQRAVRDPSGKVVRALDRFVALVAQLRSHKVAQVTVAAAMTPEQIARLSAQLIRVYGVGVDMVISIDPEVMGGMKIEIEDELIDGTVRSRIDEAHRLIA